jgi:hypothetical protein
MWKMQNITIQNYDVLGYGNAQFDQSPPQSMKVKNKCTYTSIPTYTFMAHTGKILTSCNMYGILL